VDESGEVMALSTMRPPVRTIVYSVLHLAAAAAVYRYLITGGWLTNRYHLDDPNMVNLFLAIFEPIAVLSVVVFWIWRTPALRRSMSVLLVVQILIGAGFLLFLLLFAITWHPKMM
jgi:hypothetical protein